MTSPRRQRSPRPAPPRDLAKLHARLAEAEEALRAIRVGEVDAVIVAGKQGPQVFTLEGAERPYRTLIESMNEGALTLSADTTILYANQCFARMVKRPLQQVTGSSFRRLLSADDWAALEPLVQRPKKSGSKIQVVLNAGDGTHLPVQISIRPLPTTLSKGSALTMVVTDMTQARHVEELLRTKSRRTEAALRESEAKLITAFASMTEAIFIADASGRLTDFNDEFVRYHRFKNRDECSRTIADCPKYLEVYFADGTPVPLGQWAMARALRGETASNVEYRLCRKETGETWWGSYCFGPIHDRDGRFAGAVVTAREITERKRAEAALRESEERFRSIAENQSEGMLLFDPQGNLVFENSASLRIHGSSIADLRISQEDYSGIWEGWDEGGRLLPMDQWPGSRALRGERFENEVLHARRSDTGLEFDASYNGCPIYDASGKLTLACITVREINAQRKAEKALTASRKQLQDVVDGTPAIVYAFDLEGRFVLANATLAELLNTTPEQMMGKRRHELMPKQDAEWHEANDRQVLESGRALQLEEHSELKGRSITWLTTKFPLRDAQGKIYAVAGISADISERKRVEEALGETEERLRSVMENMSEGLIVFDPQGNWLYQNPNSLRIHGYTSPEAGQFKREELPAVYKIWDTTGHLLSFEDWPIARVCRQERFHDQVLRVLRVDTGHEWVASYNGCPIVGADGKLRMGFITIRDISIEAQAEEKSRQLHEAVAQEKDRLSALVNSISDEIWFADTNGKFALVNPTGSREFALGTAGAPDVRKLARDLQVHRPDGSLRPIEEAPSLRALRGEIVRNEEEIIRTPGTGELRSRQVSSSPVRDAAGNIIGSVSVVRDITEHKRAEAAVRESEERFRTMANSMPQLAWIARADGHRFWYNQPWYEYTGTTPEQMEGWGWQIVHDPAVLPRVMENWTRAIAAGQPFEMEFSLRGADGKFRIFLTRAQPLKDAAGKVMQWCGTNTDITLHKEAESKLREQLTRLALFDQITRAISERLNFQSILKVVTDNLEHNLPADFCCVCLLDEQAKTFEVAQVGVKSAALATELALSEHALISLDCDGLSQSALGQLVYEPDVREKKSPFPQRLAKGGLRSLVIAPLPVEGKVTGLLIVARSEARTFLEAECEFLKQLSEHVALAYHQAKLHNSLQMAFDALQKTQQAAMQRERLRALGQMASGITHDISNAISPVTLYTASLLEHEPNLSVRARDYLQTIHQSVQNVAETIARMREFYHPRDPQVILTRTCLNNLAQQALDLTRVRWRDSPQERGIVIQTQVGLAEDLPDIMGVESEIRDAIVNLIFNAVDAMPGGGTLTVRTVTQPIAPGTGGTPGARQACLELIDTGIGMDEDTRRRCVEPFFTTKGEHGTGLGLAMVYGMIKRHGAEMEIQSTPGRGTTVRMIFPVSAVASNGVCQPLEAKPEAANQRILFIDDDPLLTRSMRDILETDGHTVVTAAGGQEGIHAFIHAQECNEAFTMVITDLGMPHVDGRKVASAVKAASPSTPVIMLTGWGQRLEAEGDIPAQVDRLLCKPPKLRELREALAACCPPGQSQSTKA